MSAILRSRGPRVVFDSHLHVMSNGKAPFPYVAGNAPHEQIQSLSSHEQLTQSAMASENYVFRGAIIVQPAAHQFDHSYVESAMTSNADWRASEAEKTSADDHSAPATKPLFTLYGMALANPKLETLEAAMSDLRAIAQSGKYHGVRFNPMIFPTEEGITSSLGTHFAKEMYKLAGELNLPVGIMPFTGLGVHVPAVREFLQEYPQTKLIIDHFGFFRQPATGGIIEEEDPKMHQVTDPAQFPSWLYGLYQEIQQSPGFHQSSDTRLFVELRSCLSEKNDEAVFEQLLGLGKEFPRQIFVKLSAFFRVSKTAFPHRDVRPRVLALLKVFGAQRLLWGSDFPFLLLGGHTPSPAAVGYGEAPSIFDRWNSEEEQHEATSNEISFLKISEDDIDWLQRKSVQQLFGIS